MPERAIDLIELTDEDGGDVVNNYRWSVSSSRLALAQTPRIMIQEYQQNVSSIQQAIKYWANQGAVGIDSKQTADPYEGLYSVEKATPGNYYTFPFFSSYNHAIQNAWGENKGTIGQAGAEISDAVTQAARVVFPSAGIEAAKSWEGSTPAAYSFTFHLFNTVDPKEDYKRNKKLLHALVNNNLLDKIDFISIRPPAICKITIPGVRGTTVGVMSTIEVSNVGQINYINGENIPDAYEITISIQELLTESRQIWNNKLSDKVFSQTEMGAQGADSLPDAAKKIVTDFGNSGNGIDSDFVGPPVPPGLR
jgi:hypothetical protein